MLLKLCGQKLQLMTCFQLYGAIFNSTRTMLLFICHSEMHTNFIDMSHIVYVYSPVYFPQTFLTHGSNPSVIDKLQSISIQLSVLLNSLISRINLTSVQENALKARNNPSIYYEKV